MRWYLKSAQRGTHTWLFNKWTVTWHSCGWMNGQALECEDTSNQRCSWRWLPKEHCNKESAFRISSHLIQWTLFFWSLFLSWVTGSIEEVTFKGWVELVAKGCGGKVGRVLVHPGLRPTEASLRVSVARAAGRRSKGLSKQWPAHQRPLPCGGIWTFLGESREALEGFLEEERSKPGLRRLRNLCNHSVTREPCSGLDLQWWKWGEKFREWHWQDLKHGRWVGRAGVSPGRPALPWGGKHLAPQLRHLRAWQPLQECCSACTTYCPLTAAWPALGDARGGARCPQHPGDPLPVHCGEGSESCCYLPVFKRCLLCTHSLTLDIGQKGDTGALPVSRTWLISWWDRIKT